MSPERPDIQLCIKFQWNVDVSPWGWAVFFLLRQVEICFDLDLAFLLASPESPEAQSAAQCSSGVVSGGCLPCVWA